MSEPIRVLHIVTHMNRGGLETMIMNYYRHIDRTKVQFDFLVHRNEKKAYDDEIEFLGGKIYHLPPLNPLSINYRKKIKEFFCEHPEYQIVHCHLDCMSSLPLKYAKKAGIKNRIAHAHSTSQDKNFKFILKKYYMNKIPQYATHLYACGEEAGKWMFSGCNFKVIKNCIDFNNFKYDSYMADEVRNELGIKKNDLVIGHVGRFCYPKNHQFLVDVFKEIHNLKPNSILLLIGTGELEKEIKDKVIQNNLNDSIKFLGLRTDIHRLLNAMDCYVFPSNYEGFPVSIVEAQASGLLCFISDRVPQECIISDQVKVISLDENANQWAKQILSVQSNYERNNKEIKDSGFDIGENSVVLMKLYEEMVK